MGDRVDYLYEPEGTELHWDALKAKDVPKPEHASLSGAAPSYSHHTDRQGLVGTQMSATASLPPGTKAEPKQMSHEELMAKAQAMLAKQQAQNEAQMSHGPAQGPRDDAGGKMPDWLVQAGGSDEDRAAAYRQEPKLQLSPDEVRDYLRDYRGPPGHT